MPGKKLQSKDTLAEHKKQPPVERKFVLSWNERQTLAYVFRGKKVMTCSSWIEFYGESAPINPNLKGQNTFLVGCNNMRLSALVEHKKCKAHLDGCRKAASTVEVSQSKAGKALTLLKSTQRAKLSLLFRNVHAIVKNNRPLRDYVWLYDLQKERSFWRWNLSLPKVCSAFPFI